MNKCNYIEAFVTTQDVSAYTLPVGPAGVGIADISLKEKNLVITLEDGRTFSFFYPVSWYGTRTQYNALSPEKKETFGLCFIEEGT